MLSGDGAAAKPDCIASLLKTRMVDREGERGEERRKERKRRGRGRRKGKVLLRAIFDLHECACTYFQNTFVSAEVKPLDSLSLHVLLIGSVALDLTSFILVGQSITLGVMVGDHMLS